MLPQVRIPVLILLFSLIFPAFLPDSIRAGNEGLYPQIDGCFSSPMEYTENTVMVVSHEAQLGKIYFKKYLIEDHGGERLAIYGANHLFHKRNTGGDSDLYLPYNQPVGYRINYFKFTFPGGEYTESFVCDPGECPRGDEGDTRIMRIVTELAECPFWDPLTSSFPDDSTNIIHFVNAAEGIDEWRIRFPCDPLPGEAGWDLEDSFGVCGVAGFNASANEMGYIGGDPVALDIYEDYQFVTADADFLSDASRQHIAEFGLMSLFQGTGTPGFGNGDGDTKIKDKTKPGGKDCGDHWLVPSEPFWWKCILWEEFYNGGFPSIP